VKYELSQNQNLAAEDEYIYELIQIPNDESMI